MTHFTVDWMHDVGALHQALKPLADKPVSALEIGSYEGRSACWLMDHILTHPQARLTCVDPYEFTVTDSVSAEEARVMPRMMRLKDARALFLDNTEPYRIANRLEYADTMSGEDVLKAAAFDRIRYHLIYLDASHSPAPVLRDMVLAWECLEPGGFLVVDDLTWASVPSLPHSANGPGKAWRAFLSCYTADVLHEGEIGILRRPGGER